MIDKRPHVETIECSVGEYFRRIESGETANQPDADYTSMVTSQEKKRKIKPDDTAFAPAP